MSAKLCESGDDVEHVSVAFENEDGSYGPGAKPWYFIYRRTCVLCGHGTEHRERRYTPRPEDWNERHEDAEYACDEHFI